MSLECIYVTRHGFRSNWVVNPATGDYTAYIRTPTGIAADPALTSHGVQQARELAAYLSQFGTGAAEAAAASPAAGAAERARLLPPVERIYCSPWYRCLQTVQPFVESAAAAGTGGVRCEPGLVDWFGPAPFVQPQPAPVADLQRAFFPWIDTGYRPAAAAAAVPRRHGESMAQLHARVAAALEHIVRQSDEEGVRAVLVCSHAAPIIAMGRALTGRVPADVETEDFGAFTCGLSVFRRRQQHQQQQQQDAPVTVPWDDPVHTLAGETWTGGRGVAGGWDCEVNCDCSFLSDGEERGWRFSGDDESFAGAGAPAAVRQDIVDAGLGLGVVVEGGQRRAQAAATTAAGAGGEGREDGGGGNKKGASRL